MDAQDFMPSEAALRQVRAGIEAYEVRRDETRRGAAMRIAAYMAAVVAAVAVLAWAFNAFADPREQWLSAPHVFLYVAGIIGVVLAWRSATAPSRRLRQSFREELLPVIFGFIGELRYRKGETPPSMERLPAETLGSFDRVVYDDEISGVWQGMRFELYEAAFSQRTGKLDGTVFRGVIVAVETETPFPGVLVATRKANTVTSFFHGLFGKDLEQVESGAPELDAAYDFRTDNSEAARPLVGGRLAQALEWLGETWPDEPARVALKQRDVFLLLPHARNFFELPDVSVPLDYGRHVAPMIADMASLLATAALVRRVGSPDAPAPRS